jgi:hypothetical protein
MHRCNQNFVVRVFLILPIRPRFVELSSESFVGIERGMEDIGIYELAERKLSLTVILLRN